ncbi:MAG: hypothetical protein KBC83_04545 [Candidatus Moranbacteria bacterium]|jgi:hypothetical protein|nr:hypothetical protein [Candidatus Moranbacteria bacterium]MBP9801900.1 hypothetical protein [Candidatus Moranbacteria bacterium]
MAGVELGGSNVPSPLMAGGNPASVNTENVSWPPPKKNKKKLIWILIFFLLLLVGGGIFWFFQSKLGSQGSRDQPKEILQEKKPVVQTQQDQMETEKPLTEARYQSENFRAESIVIGGEAELFVPEDDLSPLEITDIRGEAFTEKNKQEVRLTVTWQTNKLSQAEIEYAKGSGQTPKVAREEGFGISHSIIIPGLDQASTYVYVIKSEDRFGNAVSSEQHAVYTGSKTVSLFDLIADAVGEVFGWAVKKK